MYIGLFKKQYVARLYGPQKIVNGYASAPYVDVPVRLDVQPLSTDEIQNLPEGDRSVKRVKAFGPDKFSAADDYTHTPGDRLFYRGYWYECKASYQHDGTPIGQNVSDWVILPHEEQEDPPVIEKPEPDDDLEPNDIEPDDPEAVLP